MPVKDFRELLANVCSRPGMYVGRCSLTDISHYLNGYCDGLSSP